MEEVSVEKLSRAPSSVLFPGPCCAGVAGQVEPNKEHSSVTSVLHFVITILPFFASCPAQRFVLFGTFGGLYSNEVARSSLLDF